MSSRPDLSVKDAVAVISGAGGGIGTALSLNLARRGCHLALTDLSPELLAKTAAAARSIGVKVSEHVFDIADPKAIAAFPEAVQAEHGGAALLINNAGVALAGSFEQVSLEEFEWLFDINFWSVVRMSKAFLPLLKQAPQAQIANLSSIFGLVGTYGQVAYSASKFAIRAVSECLNLELEAQGDRVAVTSVHPAGVRTPIARNTRVSAGMPQELVNRDSWEKPLTDPPEAAAELIIQAMVKRQKRVLCGKFAIMADIVQRVTPTHYSTVFAFAMSGGRRRKPPVQE